jgi:predicted N-formylglutamate amidohydrolase
MTEQGVAEIQHGVTEAYETYGYLGHGPLVITCEHASNRVPSPLRTTDDDRAWLNTHWGWDIGARTVARELVRRSGSFAVLARFSRLVCDPNRPPEDKEFIRTQTEGWSLTFNRKLEEAEAARRQTRYFDPYHQAVDSAIRHRMERPDGGDTVLLSVHSFTPIWNGRIRPMDMGVLFRHYEPVARRFGEELRKEGFEVALNEPYSALDGLSYAVERHGTAHNLVYLELELNQSLVCTPSRARKVAAPLARAISRLQVRSKAR